LQGSEKFWKTGEGSLVFWASAESVEGDWQPWEKLNLVLEVFSLCLLGGSI